MRLLQLTSSNPKFNSITFNKELSIIVGTQLSKERKKSINGIGKSMSLNLIHYMFGAEFKSPSEKKLEQYLSKYGQFELSLIDKDIIYTIRKNFSSSEFYINDEKVIKTKYRDKLKELFLSTELDISFKQLFNCFARRYSSDKGMIYYSNILSQQGRPLEDYYQQFTNLYLLNIDMSLVKESFSIRDKLDKLKNAEKTVKEYEEALDKTNINDIRDERVNLETQLDSFIIAENYDILKNQADILTNQINEFRNKVFYSTKKLQTKKLNYDKSEYVDIDIDKIESLFNEANFFFKQNISKRLDEAQKFHNNLLANRKKRLKDEISILEIEIEELDKDMKELAFKRDTILKDLNNKGALEERDSLKDRIKTLYEEEKNLERYEHILSDFREDKVNLDVEEALVRKKSLTYLNSIHKNLLNTETLFRNLVKEFYDNEGGVFKLEQAPSAKYLFNIISHIPKEGSQGVNEVKIFCYDVLLYLLNPDLLGFLAHDGCLFSEMDRRQQSTILKVVINLTKNYNLQYFLNIGDSTLNSILKEENDILNKTEKDFIKECIVLELSDDDEKNWLFGESFD
jgi:uncharacterized protein YydD (DUF2326 family)